MQIKVDSLDSIDEGMRDHFVPFKEGDKEIFVHKDLADTMKDKFRIQGDLTNLSAKFDGMKERLTQFEEAERQRAAEKEQRELDDKKKNGKLDEVVADYERRLGETKQQYEDRINTLIADSRNKEKSSVVSDLSTLATKSGQTALKRLIAQDIDFTDDGEMIVLQDGKATSLSIEEYKAKLPELYPSLVAEVQSSGGQAKGGLGGGSDGSKTMTRQDFDAMSHKDKISFMGSGGTVTD